MIKFFVWKEEFSVGIIKIDDQHKRLIDIINDFYTAFTERVQDEKLDETLNHLFDYCQYHFNTEENLFVQSDYKGKEEHIGEHKKIISTLAGLLEEKKDGKKIVTYKLMSFLRSWLKNHILQEDKKYASHLSEYIMNNAERVQKL